MSVQAMSWVIDHAEVGGANLLVLLMIANHTISDGTRAYPSVPTLARECRMSERQVQRILRSLVQAGQLEVTSRKRAGPKVYRVAGMGGDILSPGVVTPEAEGVTSPVPGGDVAMSPEPSVNHQNRPAARRRMTDEACALCHRAFGPDVPLGLVGVDPEDGRVIWCVACAEAMAIHELAAPPPAPICNKTPSCGVPMHRTPGGSWVCTNWPAHEGAAVAVAQA